ncbi:uncharacterized protein CELE_C14C10.10 [Caenorhabditis elegans]|uniref:Uncharacterized protein n=1 Tax=Caenorhabditis elegans TaxID=6239 RepID=A0A2K5ATX1_CAEEL|nr:Uncharacterized protein CELE_C14C10.10 [Caenorhabditis elegans]SPC47958.2 Uncharacterized protein CELE_C14C10.10 [Caenorhabditis elegans]|eukprot:NP_001348769.2 Uncharacterized protein CELE_C14C10.10 [Caenorhabditis elegans]
MRSTQMIRRISQK